MQRQTTRFPLDLLTLFLLFLPLLCASSREYYAVIFDARSTRSIVQAFRFDNHLDLLPIFSGGYSFYGYDEPGLSSYADNPSAAALSLKPLLDLITKDVVPKHFQPETPLIFGATDSLRLLKGDAAAKILQAVRDLFKNETTLSYKAERVSVLDGTLEGSYFWIALNYLSRNLGKQYDGTLASINLVGDSVQMTYAISKESASKAPKAPNGEPYVLKKSLLGNDYYLYAHSYLNYGVFAARTEFFKAFRNSSSNPCVLGGYNGYYTYNGVAYKASSPKNGSSLKECRALAKKVLKIMAPCQHEKCTFDGVWNGGGGDGFKNLYVSSFFYDYASWVRIIEGGPAESVKPIQYLNAAKIACNATMENIDSVFDGHTISDVLDIPYVCMDLVYQYTLLVDGFGLHPKQEITAVTTVLNKDLFVGVTWPLGFAIDVVSSNMS